MMVEEDGAIVLILVSVERDYVFDGLNAPLLPTMLELMRIDRGGKIQARVSIPEGLIPYNGCTAALPAALPGGGIALFVESPLVRSPNELADLVRLSRDGKVLHRATIGSPKRLAPENVYNKKVHANFMKAAPDGTLIVGGTFGGGGPPIPGWGHYTANGARLADEMDNNMTPGPGITSVAFDSDGGFRVAGSHFSGLGQLDAVLNVYDASGRLKTRKVILRQGGEYGVSIFTDSGLVFIGNSRKNDSAIRFFDRNGTLRRSTPGKENYKDSPDASLLPEAPIADGAGLAGLLGEDAEMKQIVRIDSAGRLA